MGLIEEVEKKSSYSYKILKDEGELNREVGQLTRTKQDMRGKLNTLQNVRDANDLPSCRSILFIVNFINLRVSTVNKKGIGTFEREWTQFVRGVGLGWHRVTFPFIVYRHDVTMADCILLTGPI